MRQSGDLKWLFDRMNGIHTMKSERANRSTRGAACAPQLIMTRQRKLRTMLALLALVATVTADGHFEFVGNMASSKGKYSVEGNTLNLVWTEIDHEKVADGSVRKVIKTHALTFEKIKWLLDSKPDVLIIALGWDGVTTPDDRIRRYRECETHLLKNKEAIELFNRLKGAGRLVAIHYHSTC